MVSLKISSKNTHYNESSKKSFADLYKKTTLDAVKFKMSEDVVCISTLKIENETITYKDDTDLYLQTLLPYNEQAVDYKEKFKTSSSIYYNLEKKEEGYSILSITETTAPVVCMRGLARSQAYLRSKAVRTSAYACTRTHSRWRSLSLTSTTPEA